MQSAHSDVLILGAGVIGLSCALCLLKTGAAVRVLDMGTAGSGASHGNCGTLTPSHSAPLCAPGLFGQAVRRMFQPASPLYIQPRLNLARWRWLWRFSRHATQRHLLHGARARSTLLLRSRGLIEEWVRSEPLDCGFADLGALTVYLDPAALALDQALQLDLLGSLNIPVEPKSAEQVVAMAPELRAEVAGGLFHPGDAQLQPDRHVAALAKRVRELGGLIEEGVRVERFVHSRQRIEKVRARKRAYSAERVVLAAGAWSPLLAAKLGLHLPMQPGKGYSMTWAQPGQGARMPLTLHEASVCVTAWEGGVRLGSTMEFSGYSRRMNRTRLAALERGAARYLRELPETGGGQAWWGWRPMCVDDIPLIGPSTRISNLMLATGHGMMGMGMSAATGELVAALCAGPAPLLDPTPYAPARFDL